MGKRVTVGYQDDELRPREVRLIDVDGTQIGIVPIRDALQMARDRGLKLFITQPESNPPVARILDYERRKLENERSNRETKKTHHVQDIKEIKMRYEIEEHDYQVKLRAGTKFLNDGDKVKVLIVLRGREMQHKDMAITLMNKFANELKEVGMIDREPKIEGKSILMILSPLSTQGRRQIIEKTDV